MKLRDYKGYSIEIAELGEQFYITGVEGWFDTVKQARAKIDAIVLAESKEGLPIEAIHNMKPGKITSYNREEAAVWFTRDGGSRSKEKVFAYSGAPAFFKPTTDNLALVKRYHEIDQEIVTLKREQSKLEESLTEAIKFSVDPR